jgi:hypothetical protein
MIGPVDTPYTCIATAYSESRLVPPFNNTLTSVDWRDWGIVNSV